MKQKIQLCDCCASPTHRCEDDALTITENGNSLTVCENCYEQAVDESQSPPHAGERESI